MGLVSPGGTGKHGQCLCPSSPPGVSCSSRGFIQGLCAFPVVQTVPRARKRRNGGVSVHPAPPRGFPTVPCLPASRILTLSIHTRIQNREMPTPSPRPPPEVLLIRYLSNFSQDWLMNLQKIFLLFPLSESFKKRFPHTVIEYYT